MVVAVWSVKGGVGASSVAAMLAIGQVEQAYETLLVDLCGDMLALLGLDDEVDPPGVTDWCALAAAEPEALRRLEIEARVGLRVLARGSQESGTNPQLLLQALDTSDRHVIVDCGVVSDDTTFTQQVVRSADRSLVVVRPCYLNLRMLGRTSLEPSGVIVIKEKNRVLGRADIESAADAPVVAEIAFDSGIARSIDAGLVSARLPRPFVRAMAKVLTDAA